MLVLTLTYLHLLAHACTAAASNHTQDGASALSSKEAELRRKEAELKAKEAEMAKREAEMIRSGGSAKKKNWPTCYPCLYHDIAGEIPVPARNMVRGNYLSIYLFIYGQCALVPLSSTCRLLSTAFSPSMPAAAAAAAACGCLWVAQSSGRSCPPIALHSQRIHAAADRPPAAPCLRAAALCPPLCPLSTQVRFVYWSWYGLALCLLMNVACASIVLGKGKSGAVASWFLAIVYLLLGLPLSFFLWYRRLYNGSKADSAFGYLGFFIMYLIHIAFCIWAAVAIPIAASKWSFCGFLSMIRAFDIDAITGFFFLVGASMWTLEAVWSFWCLKSVYGYFRGRGGHEQVRKETLRAAVNASTRV